MNDKELKELNKFKSRSIIKQEKIDKASKENKMKIMCKWCKVSIFCHIVSEEVSDHHGAYGIDSIKMLKIKIHKHFKGKNYCKGSDRTITTPLDKVNDNKVHYN